MTNANILHIPIDVDECQKGSYVCHEVAKCVNAIGSYDCKCKPGYEGDGKNTCSGRNT